MGRKRKSNKHLPSRVELHHGSYRYLHRSGKKTTLARADDYAEMLRALADVIGQRPSMITLGTIMDRYELEVLPTKAATSVMTQTKQLGTLRAVFGHMDPNDLCQSHAYEYSNTRSSKYPTTASRELELMSHVCTMAFRWGAMRTNPLIGIEKPKRQPRRRYVSNDEYIHVWNLASPMVRCVMDLAMLTALRRGDIFRIERRHINDDGLYVKPGKTQNTTGVELLFEWTPALRDVVGQALSLKPQVRQWVVCNRKGKMYTKNGFDSVWRRLMDKATAGEAAIDRFQFRDLRRKSASDEADENIAQARLGHASIAVTKRVYRVKPNRVKPLR